MHLVGYKFLDEHCTRRSADVLKMNKGERPHDFIKRCEKHGYVAQDPRNVVDHYKFLSDELIQGDLEAKRHPNLYLMCINIINDFNVAAIQRCSNCFGVNKVYIFGNKNYDRRGACGAYKYIHLEHIKDLNEFNNIKNNFDIIVSLENCAGSKSINEYTWDYTKNTLIIVGQESIGIPGEFIDMSDALLEIRMRGSIRSLNVSQAATVALFDYDSKFNNLLITS